MNNKDAFGCTTFRKGNYLGRSYDFYCNNVASSVLHTGRIEGVRYESIGMSGSSFNGMIKEKALDGSIDKATMDTLFSSIVDGINENGVAISTLVVPKGDKGVTTGTNPSKPTLSARMVSRVVMDKAYSAKHAIKLLSELNLKQNWDNPEYELHWMIADATDTYIVETVNNKLSYLGPSAIEGIEDLYNGILEADVVTNFYISGFSTTPPEFKYQEGEKDNSLFRQYEIPTSITPIYDGVGEDRHAIKVYSGSYLQSFSTTSSIFVIDEDKYYITLKNVGNDKWCDSWGDEVAINMGKLYLEDGTALDMKPLSEYTEGISSGYNTFEMPITNPTVTPYGAGLERFQLIKDAIKDATPSSDEEAMGIINLVQYTNAYKNDTAWYSEFVSHLQGVDNRTELTAIKNTGKLSTRVGSIPDTNDNRWFYEVLPPTDSSYFGSWNTSEKFFDIKSESHEESLRVNQGNYWSNHSQPSPSLDPNKWYTEIRGGDEGTDYEYISDIHYLKGSEVKELIRSVTTSDYVDGINELKATYQSIFSEGGKGAVRALGDTLGDGASWHSNHQCVYDIANKTMLVYPSENGEHAFRVDVHGEVEDEAVEIGGGGGGSEGKLTADAYYITTDSLDMHYYLVKKELVHQDEPLHTSSKETVYYCDICPDKDSCKEERWAPDLFLTLLEENKDSYYGYCNGDADTYIYDQDGNEVPIIDYESEGEGGLITSSL